MSENQNFDLEIISFNSKKTLKVDWIDVQSPNGNFIVGVDHSPTISILKNRSKLQFKNSESKKVETIDIYGGIFKISDNKAKVILDL